MNRNCLLVSVTLLCLFVAGFAHAVEADKNNEQAIAYEQAKTWLDLLEKGQFATSWKNAAQVFQQKIKKQAWEQTIEGLKKKIGGMAFRQPIYIGKRDSVMGMPKADYMLIMFKTTFEKPGEFVECMTLIKEKEGIWKVAGYFLL